jgi:two-component sensor histidine kinase
MMARTPLSTDVNTTLALAVIAASQAPLLLLDGDANVIAASDSFLKSFDLAANAVRGRSLFKLGSGEWNLPRLRSLLSAIGSGEALVDAYEIDMTGPDGTHRTLILNAQRLEFTEQASLRIMLTVVDGTEARAAEKLKNDLIRDKDILLREIQHRVANSLQIIASVLLQNARKVTSEESRVHLRDAHQRVMSVAAVQRQLAASSIGNVPIKPYLTQLCQSIGASMIEDHDLVSIEVNGDGSATSGEISVSLGLIVTELVINALKHAFPSGRKGHVTVDYQSEHEGWALSVSDDGIGMPAANDGAKAGLGTAIVQALAAQLSATITVTDRHPGTGVSVVHRRPHGLVKDADKPELRAV